MIPAKADSFLFEMGSFFVRFISPHNSIIKAIPHKDSAADAPWIFSSDCIKISAGILTYFKGFWCKMTEKDQAAAALSRKAVFVRCCLNAAVSIFGGISVCCTHSD